MFTKNKWFRLQPHMFFLIIIFSGGCKSSDDSDKQQSIATEILTLKPETAVIDQSYPARLEGRVNVDIRPQVSGYLDKIYIDEGAFVEAGQPLFKINEKVYREQKKSALAALSVAKAQLAAARLELDKYEKLAQRKVVADFQYEKAKVAYQTAMALMEQHQALLASADLNIGFTVIKAPVSGYVGMIPKRIGNLVGLNDQLALTTLSQVDGVYAYFSIPEVEMLKINDTRQGHSLLQKLQSFQHVRLLMANGKIYDKNGKIDIMDGQLDKGTGSVMIRASFPNPQHLLRSGSLGRLILSDEQSNVFRIPVLATLEIQDKVFVGLLDKKHTVHRVELKQFVKSGDYYITRSTFKSGDRIVANELGGIPEKSTVSIKKNK